MYDYKIVVKNWMTNYNTFMDENSILMKLNSNPMPLCIMYGKKLKETAKMVQMELWGDILESDHINCVKCGRKLTNEISKLLGIGPECGNHNYINPFESEEELNEAKSEVINKIKTIKWTGWILKSGIISLEALNDNVIDTNCENIEVTVEIKPSVKCNSDYSMFISFPYVQELVDNIREYVIRYWIADSKQWELPIKYYDNICNKLNKYDLHIVDSNKILSNLQNKRKGI